MRRAALVVRWAGLVAVLLSLFAPMNTSWAATVADRENPAVMAAQESATPEAPPATDLDGIVAPAIGPVDAPLPGTSSTPTGMQEDTSGTTTQGVPAEAGIQSGTGTSLSVIADPATVPVGSSIGITFTVTTTARASLTSTLPAGAGIIWTLNSPVTGCSLSDNFLSCEWARAQSAPVQVSVTGSTTTEDCGTYSIAGTLSPIIDLPLTQRVNVTVSCAEPEPQPTATISITSPGSVQPGDDAFFDIRLSNAGSQRIDGSGFGFSVTLPLLPDGIWRVVHTTDTMHMACAFTYTGADQSGVSCTGGVLDPGESITVRIEHDTTAALACGAEYHASATIIGANTGSSTGTIVVECPGIDVSVSAPATVAPGDTLTVTLTLTTPGASEVTEAGLESRLPDLGTLWQVTGEDGVCAIEDNVLTCEGLRVPPLDGTRVITLSNDLGTDPAICGDISVVVNLTGNYDGTDQANTRITCDPLIQLTNQVVSVTSADRTISPVSPNDTVDGLYPGDIVTYQLVATNTGNVALTDIVLSPDTATVNGCTPEQPVASLAPGASITCQADHVMTEEDVLAGSYLHTATVDSTQTDPVSMPAPAVYTVAAIPTVALTNSVITVNGKEVGEGQVEDLVLRDVVTYEIVVTNTGPLSLSDVLVTGSPATVSLDACDRTDLALGASHRCTASHTITQDDLDQAAFHFTATVNGTATNGPIDAVHRTASVLMSQTPLMAIEGRAEYQEPTEPDPLGTIRFTLDVTNDGNVTLTDVQVTAPSSSVNPFAACSVDGLPVQQLSPGTTMRCVQTHRVLQHDMDAGEVSIDYQVTSSQTESRSGTITELLLRTPEVAISIDAGDEPEGGFDRGDKIHYAMVVTNTGNVTLTDLAVTIDHADTSLSCEGGTAQAASVIPSLAPGLAVTCRASHTVTQADVEAGALSNAAHVTATAPEGTDPTSVTDTVTASSAINNAPGITLSMSHGEDDDLVAGSTVTYVLIAQNTGKVTLSGVQVTSGTLPEASPLTCRLGEEIVGQPISLGRGEEIRCQAIVTITQDDVDRGFVANSAEVSGTYQDEPVSDTATNRLDGTRTASVELNVSPDQMNGITAGTGVTFTYTLRNTGNVTLTSLTVTDDVIPGIDCGDGTNIIDRLAPGAGYVTCTASISITQALIDGAEPAGDATWSLTTSASITGETPSGMEPARATDQATTTITGPRAISVDIQATVTNVDGVSLAPGSAVTGLSVGQEITYTVIATNTGDVTLGSVALTSTMPDELLCGSDSTGTYAPGESVTCTGTLTISQEVFDVDPDRALETRFEVTATAPNGSSTSDGATVTVYLAEPSPAIAIAKSVVGENKDLAVGTTVTYALTVTNSGTVTLGTMALTDDTATLACRIPDTLPPSATITCTATGIITEADLLAGGQKSTTTVTALAPDGTQVNGTASAAVTTVAPSPALTLTTNLTRPTEAREGTAVDLAITVSNTGNVTVHDISLTVMPDTIVWEREPAALASLAVLNESSPGGVIGTLGSGETVTVRGTYTVMAADAATGSIRFTAGVAGTDAEGARVAATADDVLLVVVQPQPDQPATPTPGTPVPEPTPESTAAPDLAQNAGTPTATPATDEPAVTALPSTGSGHASRMTAEPWTVLAGLFIALLVGAGIRARSPRG